MDNEGNLKMEVTGTWINKGAKNALGKCILCYNTATYPCSSNLNFLTSQFSNFIQETEIKNVNNDINTSH